MKTRSGEKKIRRAWCKQAVRAPWLASSSLSPTSKLRRLVWLPTALIPRPSRPQRSVVRPLLRFARASSRHPSSPSLTISCSALPDKRVARTRDCVSTPPILQTSLVLPNLPPKQKGFGTQLVSRLFPRLFRSRGFPRRSSSIPCTIGSIRSRSMLAFTPCTASRARGRLRGLREADRSALRSKKVSSDDEGIDVAPRTSHGFAGCASRVRWPAFREWPVERENSAGFGGLKLVSETIGGEDRKPVSTSSPNRTSFVCAGNKH